MMAPDGTPEITGPYTEGKDGLWVRQEDGNYRHHQWGDNTNRPAWVYPRWQKDSPGVNILLGGKYAIVVLP